MPLIDLHAVAHGLPTSWQSRIVGQAGACNVKILHMNEQAYPEETHDYDEALVVLSGKLCLVAGGRRIEVGAGSMYLAKAGEAHAVAEGSHGVLMIIDPAAGRAAA